MDENKRKKLHEIGYQIKPCCLLCKHGNFGWDDDWFGTCKKYSYDHLKHSDSKRELSINRHGVCKDGFEPKETDVFGKFDEFYNKEQ